MGRKWRPDYAKNVADEIKWQVTTFGVKEVLIYDDNFSIDKNRAIEICNIIIESGINIKFQFANGLRVDNVDIQLLIKLKKMGTWFMGIAPKSGIGKS